MHKAMAAALAGIMVMFVSAPVGAAAAQEPPERTRATTRGAAAPAEESGEAPPRVPGARGPRGLRPGRPGASEAGAPASQPSGQAITAAEQRPVVTEHQITIDGQTLHYQATCGMIPLRDDAGRQVRGNIFYIAYEKTEPAAGAATSPATTYDGEASAGLDAG